MTGNRDVSLRVPAPIDASMREASGNACSLGNNAVVKWRELIAFDVLAAPENIGSL